MVCSLLRMAIFLAITTHKTNDKYTIFIDTIIKKINRFKKKRQIITAKRNNLFIFQTFRFHYNENYITGHFAWGCEHEVIELKSCAR